MTAAPMKPRERVTYVALGAVLVLTLALLYWFGVQRGQDADSANKEAGAANQRALSAEGYIIEIDADCRGRSGPDLALELNKAGRCPLAEQITERAETDPLPGPKGDRGDTGLTGATGATGPKGDKGEKGDKGADSTVPGPEGPIGPIGPVGPAGADGADGQTPDLSGYATETWVLALIRALGCEVAAGEKGPPLIFTCSITGKP